MGERNLETLLDIILAEAVKVIEADRCTLWIVDHEKNELWTKVAQGLDRSQKIRIPMGVGIAGQVAVTAKIINIPDAYKDPRFNANVDLETGYKTHTILAVPMLSSNGTVTGVLQALNRKHGTFHKDDEEILSALGTHAAGAIENAILYEEIDQLFEGFVHASVVAIESRDPTTSGHSERVAKLTLGIAEAVERFKTGPFANTNFTSSDLRELRYASLLHDFGKVGVREHVLIKEKKLYPWELERVEMRFRLLMMQKKTRMLEEKLLASIAGERELEHFEKTYQHEMSDLKEILRFIRACNEPTVLEKGGFERLHDIAKINFQDDVQQDITLLKISELERLSLPKGTLDAQERLEIESHVTHTFRFLSQIPWTRDLRRIPEIAYAHHEKLDGGGYPRKLMAQEVPIQSRMMAIADIYDALTAKDRPYKKAIPHERALSILEVEAKQGKVDIDLFNVFVDAKISETALRSH